VELPVDLEVLVERIVLAPAVPDWFFEVVRGCVPDRYEVRFSQSRLTDPEVIYANETWYMVYSLPQGSGLALSDDGLDFEDQGELDVEIGGVPGALAEADGTIRVFGCTQKGIASAVSSDGGENFSLDTTSILSVTGGACDPSMQVFGDGFAFVYKYMEPVN